MLHFAIFLVTAIIIAIYGFLLNDEPPTQPFSKRIWRWALAVVVFVVGVILAFYWISPTAHLAPFYLVDFALGGVAGFVGASWISVHKMLQSSAMLGNEWLSALESRYKFFSLTIVVIAAVQMVQPYLDTWLSGATDLEVAGLVKLQISSAANRAPQTGTSFAEPAKSTPSSDVNRVQQSLDTVMSIGSTPALDVKFPQETNGNSDCGYRIPSSPVCEDWKKIGKTLSDIRRGDGGPASQNAYAALPMVVRDIAQIAFLASKNESEFERIIKTSYQDASSPPQDAPLTWVRAMQNNYFLFTHMNGVLACVETYSKTLRDLRLQLLDSHELVRALMLLSSNPLGLSSDDQQQALQEPVASFAAKDGGDTGFSRWRVLGPGPDRDGQLGLLTSTALERIADVAANIAVELRSATARPMPDETTVNTFKGTLDDVRSILAVLKDVAINTNSLSDAAQVARGSVARLESAAETEGVTGRDKEYGPARNDMIVVDKEMQDLADVLADSALTPWLRVTRRVDQSLTNVFEKSANEMWVYGQGGRQDYERWTWGSAPPPITSDSGQECGYTSFDVFRNSLISFLGGRIKIQAGSASDHSAIEQVARSVEFTPYVSIAAANLFAGIGGTESGVALLTRWLDQIPSTYWNSSPGGHSATSQAADVWMRIRAFSALNLLLRDEDSAPVDERYFGDLLASITESMAVAKPDVAIWFQSDKCSVPGENELYKATAQFFYFYYMTLRHKAVEISERRASTQGSSREGFMDDATVEELQRYETLPEHCLATVRQFTEHPDGWRASIGVTLAQGLARRGLSNQWAGSEAGKKHPDVKRARQIFTASARLLAAEAEKSDKDVEREVGKSETNHVIGATTNPGLLELRLLGNQDPWARFLTAARRSLEALGEAPSQ